MQMIKWRNNTTVFIYRENLDELNAKSMLVSAFGGDLQF